MSDAPERIWVDADIYGYYSDVEYNPCSYEPGFDRVEYVRRDCCMKVLLEEFADDLDKTVARLEGSA